MTCSREKLIGECRKKGIPKKFRVWDTKHERWFQGSTDKDSRTLQTDSINYFGETLVLENSLFDQNEDSAWRDDPDIHGAADMIPHLLVVQSTGARDANGDEIFEGDIIETNGGLFGVVLYDNVFGGFQVINGYYGDIMTLLSKCTIQGNIFENYDDYEERLNNVEKR